MYDIDQPLDFEVLPLKQQKYVISPIVKKKITTDFDNLKVKKPTS